jgi:hypothetical protein
MCGLLHPACCAPLCLCLTSRIISLLRPLLDEPIPLYEAKVSMEVVQKNQERKKQVVQF